MMKTLRNNGLTKKKVASLTGPLHVVVVNQGCMPSTFGDKQIRLSATAPTGHRVGGGLNGVKSLDRPTVPKLEILLRRRSTCAKSRCRSGKRRRARCMHSC